MGDFNIPKVDWESRDLTNGAKKIDSNGLSVAKNCYLYQHVMEPTCFRNEDASLLHFIFTMEEEDIPR